MKYPALQRFCFVTLFATLASVVHAAGLLDTYSGATWGFSAFKLKGSYAGSWGVIRRNSDGAQRTIAFLANGRADAAAITSFCAGTFCSAVSLSDQVNGIAARQGTPARMPRVIVDSHNLPAVCPQPGTFMRTSFDARVNTPKVHVFAVVRAAYADSRWSQADEARVVVTGDVTAGSPDVTNLSSTAGISAANGLYGTPDLPGITDSLGLLPKQTYLAALPGGNSLTLGFAPGNLRPTGSATSDVLTITNAVLNGAWIVNGPPSPSYGLSAYWGVGIGSAVGYGPADWIAPRNGDLNGGGSVYQGVIGQGMRGLWGVYDYDTFTTTLAYDGETIGPITSVSDIVAYPANTGMTLFSDTRGKESTSQSCFETMVLFGNTQTQRGPMAKFLMTQDRLRFPFAPATADGFTMTGNYQPGYPSSPNNVYGVYSVGPDARGMTWNMQSGGYTWPSIAYANNINNGATMWRFIVAPGDSDMNITGAERSEISTSPSAVPGQHFSIFYQFQFERLPKQVGDWCATGQVHYNNAPGSTAPDIVSLDCKNGRGQFLTQKAGPGGFISTNCGPAFVLRQGATYAVVIDGFWSTDHASDRLTIHAGPNGAPLKLACDAGPAALWDNDTGAYLKAGIYRGFPWNNAGTIIERVMNAESRPTANAFSSYIATQPPLPTHP